MHPAPSKFPWMLLTITLVGANLHRTLSGQGSGTAAKALGGDVTMTAHASGNWEDSCQFTRQVGAVIEKSKVRSERRIPSHTPKEERR